MGGDLLDCVEAGIEPSVGSVGDSYDNALAETVRAVGIRPMVGFASARERLDPDQEAKAVRCVESRRGPGVTGRFP